MKRLKKIPLRVWLFYLLLISILFTGATFASYKSESSGGSSTRVALFANDVNVDLTITDMAPGKTVEIPISVTNYDENGMCEVSQSYNMYAEAFVGVLPLKLEWKNVDTNAIVGDSVNGQFFVSGGKREHKHKLVVSWPVVDGVYPDASLADEIEVIRLVVHCEQID